MSVLAFRPRGGGAAAPATGWGFTGPARCWSCGRDWVASVVGADGEPWFGLLECPGCHALKGHFVDPPFPTKAAGEVLHCATCGSVHFYLTRSAVFCGHCNGEQEL